MTTSDALLLPDRSEWSLEIGRTRDDALRRIARMLESNEPALSVHSPFVEGMHGEILDAPSLVIEDHSAIRLFEHGGNEAYSYRALLLAGDGDLVAIGVDRNDGFEAYCRDWLGLGCPTVLTPKAAGPDASLALRCRQDAGFLEAVTSHAESCHGLNILPYMGTWPLWELAGAIAANCDVPIKVVAPPPQLTRQVNDKIWFANLARTVCGQTAIPPAFVADNFGSLCRLVVDLAGDHAIVAIRLPNSASSAGNLVLDIDELRAVSWRALHDRLEERLLQLGWDGGFPLQIVAWEQAVIGSPSAQMWIPAPPRGPLLEAIFDQHSSGLAREFDGARPSRLADDLQYRIAQQAFEIGKVLQYLGYFGRCSLDAIVVDAEDESRQLHWVECNGRWGGVSLPLVLNRRLDREGPGRTPFVIFERAHQRHAPRELESILQALEPLLYRNGWRQHGAVLLSPGRLLDGSGYEFMVRGESVEAALQVGNKIEHLLDESES
ncbi:MAG: hypothetical protein OEO19_08795 [Gammaproteobacteria bacterium]|nr:hypothetical protein [Gammaproteobacteria bacterium]MDH3449214.1 hypothetical protein [Gammaproteobacteria bacterium]